MEISGDRGATTMPTVVCESCGASNPADAAFCRACRAFVGWGRTSVIAAVTPPAEENVETRVIPKIADGPRQTPQRATRTAPAPTLDVRLGQDQVVVPTSGARVELALMITNRSQIVDGYEVDAGGAPDWLRIDSAPLRLLPGTEDRLMVGFRMVSDGLVPAGRGTVRLRVRSLTQPPAYQVVPVAVVVPVVDAPVQVRAEPTVVRLADADVGRCVVVIDNGAANIATQVRLSGSDPELAVGFRFDPEVVTVGPGEVVRVRVAATSPPPTPGTEVTRAVTITASDGRRQVRTELTLVHAATASPMTTLSVRLDPSVLRLGTGRRGSAAVLVDNRTGRAPVSIRLTGDDPENVVSFTFAPSQLTVGPGQVATSQVRVSAPRPPSGRELNRQLTVAATDGRTSVSTSGSIIQAAGDRRPWARLALTLLGGLAMILGTILPLREASRRTAFAVDANAVAGLFNAQVDLGGFERLITFGLLILVLAGLLLFGLTGRSGRLSRFAALIAVLATVALLITVGLAGLDPTPGVGAVMIILGGVLGYIGGLLARAR